jgi:hypothetical protein
MRPEDIDELFKGRLGNLERTPSSDAWQRLQEQLQPPPKRKVIPLWWSVAATVALLVFTGYYLHLSQLPGPTPAQVAAGKRPVQQVTPPAKADRPAAQPAGEQDTQPEQLAQTSTPPAEAGNAAPKAPVQPNVSSLASARIPAAPVTGKPAPVRRVTPPQTKQVDQQLEEGQAPEQMALQKPAPVPAQVSSRGAAQPGGEAIEVVILKTEPAAGQMADAGTFSEEAEEAAVPSRKTKLVKGIFKQLKNLAAGEKVDLSEIGIDRYSVAIETQIGNRKISKTINF